MAQNSELPCDGDGVCMVCNNKPAEEDTLTCKTCNTPWHVSCLSSPPETLVSTLQWNCPDCSLLFTDVPLAPITALKSVESADLLASIRAIEADGSLTELEKAKKRQDLMSRGVNGKKNKDEDVDGGGSEVFELLGGNLNCSFCMQLPDRPVTTPCGHNFCLKCFERWIGQGKRTCAKCRRKIPPNMASHPRVNSSLVIAIRMAKMSKSFTTKVEPLKVYHFVHNQNRPDKAFTTERAKRGGKSNACSGKIFVTVPSDHFGPILEESDPVRKQGVLVGECWEDRMECRQWGTHLPHVAGIAGQSDYGAQSVALSGGYEDDEDHGEWFLYTGSGGRDLSGNKRTNKDQSFDQKFEKYNEALRVSCMKGYPVRVVRSHKEKRSSYAPEKGVRYDGVYRIEKCWRKVGIQGYKVCRYLFVRCDNEPAPWTSDERGDQPRPLPVIKELKKATDITERKEKPSWDFDEVEGCWKWKRTPPMSRKRMDTGDPEERLKAAQLMYSVDPEERQRAQKAKKKEQILSVRERLLKEFSCLICRKVITLPLTTPCAHNFCKHCLEGAFAGQTFVKERNCDGRRTLRAQKNIMKCPHCPADISDFLKNPQINRELMDVIESLQIKTEENVEEAEADVEELSKEESDSTDKKPEAGEENIEEAEADVEELSKEESYSTDKKPEAGVEMEVCTESLHELEGGKKSIQTSPIKSKPTPKKLGGKQNGKSPMKKCDAQSKDKKDSSLEDKIPESGKEKLQTPTTDSRAKRKKADNENCGSSGVRTRSMRSKELIEEENGSQLEKSKGTRPFKKKKLDFADSGSKVGGVKTRSQMSRD